MATALSRGVMSLGMETSESRVAWTIARWGRGWYAPRMRDTLVGTGFVVSAGRRPFPTMTTIETLKDKYTEVRQRIADAARKTGRRPESVMLVAGTKTAEP